MNLALFAQSFECYFKHFDGKVARSRSGYLAATMLIRAPSVVSLRLDVLRKITNIYEQLRCKFERVSYSESMDEPCGQLGWPLQAPASRVFIKANPRN
jgi:hypothetical protein